MPKARTRKTVTKRFKISGTGKLLSKHSRISHKKRKNDSSTTSRQSRAVEVAKGFAGKIKRMIIN